MSDHLSEAEVLRSYALCAPTDAVSEDLGTALQALAGLGITHCELRTVAGAPFTDLPLEQRRRVVDLVQSARLAVVLIDSDVGKAPLTLPQARQEEALKRALDAAVYVGAEAVRVLSYLVPTSALEASRAEVVERMGRMAGLAAATDTVLLVENMPGSYASSGARLGELLELVDSPALGALFDPVGFVLRKEHPFLGAFMLGPLKNYVRCLRIRDARFEDGQEVLPDQGNGDLRELISALAARSFDGFFSLDPGPSSGTKGFGAAYRAFQTIVEELL